MTCFLCKLCKPEKDGVELGYVADKEHSVFTGEELHGWKLIVMRIVEGFITEPFCWLVRKVLRCTYTS